jgi:DNA repair ATPase RecN
VLHEAHGESRVHELARMLGGVSDSALHHARTLLARP